MSLFILVQACCLKHTRPDISWTKNTGSVIVFTRCPLMPVFCLVTAELNTAGVNSRAPSPPSLSLPEFSWHTHTSVTSPRSSPPRTFNNPRRTKKVCLNGGPFRKEAERLKSRSFQSNAWGRKLDHKRDIQEVSPFVFSEWKAETKYATGNTICSSLIFIHCSLAFTEKLVLPCRSLINGEWTLNFWWSSFIAPFRKQWNEEDKNT